MSRDQLLSGNQQLKKIQKNLRPKIGPSCLGVCGIRSFRLQDVSPTLSEMFNLP